MESINGLPAHPLFVHAPVVLVPLAMLFALVLAARPSLRRKAGWALVASVAAALVTTQMAVVSGYRFDEVVAGAVNTDDHQALGEMARNLVALFALSAVAMAAVDWWGRKGTASWAEPTARSLSVLGALVSIAATVWMVRTGEEGAKLVWSGIMG